MLLVFLDFNLDIGAVRIGLIPDFLGYIIMLKGLAELTVFSDKFKQVEPWAKGMAVYAGVCYALDLFGVSFTALNFMLGLVSTIVSLYIAHGIIMGIKDIEQTRQQDLNSVQLYAAWKLLAVFSLITYLLLLVPIVAVICIITAFIVGVYYLLVFNKTKKLFYEQNPQWEA